jgi:hypothetical protein
LIQVIYKLNTIGSFISLGGGFSCRRRHEFGTDRIGNRLPQNLIDRRARMA